MVEHVQEWDHGHDFVLLGVQDLVLSGGHSAHAPPLQKKPLKYWSIFQFMASSPKLTCSSWSWSSSSKSRSLTKSSKDLKRPVFLWDYEMCAVMYLGVQQLEKISVLSGDVSNVKQDVIWSKKIIKSRFLRSSGQGDHHLQKHCACWRDLISSKLKYKGVWNWLGKMFK